MNRLEEQHVAAKQHLSLFCTLLNAPSALTAVPATGICGEKVSRMLFQHVERTPSSLPVCLIFSTHNVQKGEAGLKVTVQLMVKMVITVNMMMHTFRFLMYYAISNIALSETFYFMYMHL